MNWNREEMHSISGDEPHYLVIADGLFHSFELEQTGPYTREFRDKAIYKTGLADTSAKVTPQTAHVAIGPHGVFNVHNLGIPILVAVPYALGGEFAARLMMIVGGMLAVFLLTRVVSLTPLSDKEQLVVLLPIALSAVFVTASTQIYPDLLGGAICLNAIYMLFRGPKNFQRWDGVLTALSLSLLPWLHIRFGLPMVILLLACIWNWRESRNQKFQLVLLKFVTPSLITVGLLAIYNKYAFGHFSGPYTSDAIMLGRTAVMQFFGFFFDQNQGILIQQPLHVVGFFYLAYFYRTNRLAVITTISVLLAMLLPNATHWNLYGGWSFSGRFGWGATTVLSALTVLAMSHLWTRHKSIAKIVILLGGMIQARYLIGVFFQHKDLFPRPFDAWMGTYSIFWAPIEGLLPQWHNNAWSFAYWPNLLFTLGLLTLVLIGTLTGTSQRVKFSYLFGLVITTSCLLVLSSFLTKPPKQEKMWTGSELPGVIGQVRNSSRITSKTDGVGFLNYGPFWDTPAGSYQIEIDYVTHDVMTPNATIEVYLPTQFRSLLKKELKSTGGTPSKFSFVTTLKKADRDLIEIRTEFLGRGTLEIKSIRFQRL